MVAGSEWGETQAKTPCVLDSTFHSEGRTRPPDLWIFRICGFHDPLTHKPGVG